jgi:hypothetical protein
VPPSVQSGLKFDWGGPSLRPAPRALRLQLGNFALEPRDPNVANRARPVLTQLLSSPLIAAGPRQLLKHFLCPFRILGKKAEPRLHKCVRGETVHLLRHPFFQFCHHRGLHWLHIWKAKKLPCLRWRAVNFNSDLYDYSTPRWPSPITSAVVRCPPMTCGTAASTSTRCGTSRFTQEMVR